MHDFFEKYGNLIQSDIYNQIHVSSYYHFYYPEPLQIIYVSTLQKIEFIKGIFTLWRKAELYG